MRNPPRRLLSALSALNSVSSSFVFEAEPVPQCPASRLCLRVAPDRGSRSPLLAEPPARGPACPASSSTDAWSPCSRPSPAAFPQASALPVRRAFPAPLHMPFSLYPAILRN